MKIIFFNPNCTFKEAVNNIEVVKSRIQGLITSFSYYDLKKQVILKRKLRDSIYKLQFERWKCDRLIEFIYDDIDIETLKKLI